jgi:hypothetical protein
LREKFPPVSFTGGLTLSEAGFDLLTRLLAYDPEKVNIYQYMFSIALPDLPMLILHAA